VLVCVFNQISDHSGRTLLKVSDFRSIFTF